MHSNINGSPGKSKGMNGNDNSYVYQTPIKHTSHYEKDRAGPPIKIDKAKIVGKPIEIIPGK